jgi:hypothetical protein
MIYLIGSRHYDKGHNKKIMRLLSRFDYSDSIFLLEYNDAKYRKSKQKSFWFFDYDEMFELAEHIKGENGIVRLIDNKGPGIIETYLKKTSIFKLATSDHKKSALFHRGLIGKREEAMFKAILRSKPENYRNCCVIIGEDHLDNFIKLFRQHNLRCRLLKIL